MATSAELTAARKAKKDEFYTTYHDIELEIAAYTQYNPDIFVGKTVLLPCDDPRRSNFTKFFCDNFGQLGLSRLISTGYRKDEQGTILDITSPIQTDHSLPWTLLEGNGDFRNEEVSHLLLESDFVFTNPPFSLFREFINWVTAADVHYSILGNMNAVTSREVFRHLHVEKMWYGESIHSGDREFEVPSDYPLTAVGSRTDDKGRKFVRVKGVRWFTNIDHGGIHHRLPLLTMAENRQKNRKVYSNPNSYQEYSNYQAIEVPSVNAIPSDYDGVMGVPITFFDKCNPDQFEIVGADFQVQDGTLSWLRQPEWEGQFRTAHMNGKDLYRRVFIRVK